ncbi:MAG: hypothetical protein IJH55_06740, partial [Romboutsia sp.]|nr:hypothetical protein [Romboutsia sp.]
MSKKYDNELKTIFLEYKRSLVNDDITYSQRIERILTILGETKSKILYGKYVQNISMTYLSINLNLNRSYL